MNYKKMWADLKGIIDEYLAHREDMLKDRTEKERIYWEGVIDGIEAIKEEIKKLEEGGECGEH